MGFSNNRLERFRHLFALDGRKDTRTARIAYDYIVFRRRNSRFNQYILNCTLLLVLTIIPIKPLILVWALFQLSEFVCYWMVGRAELEIRNDCFNVKFWDRFKYAFNIAQYVLTTIAFATFSAFAHESSLVPTAASYLMVVVLSTTLNYFSARFNLFNLIWQLISFILFSIAYIYFRDLTYTAPSVFFFLVPVVLTFFAGHVGVWSYNQYYIQSLDKEHENHLVQEKLIENTRVLSREKHLIDRIQSTIGEAIIVVDFRHKILQANPAFLEMFEIQQFRSGTIDLSDLVDMTLLRADGIKRSFQPNLNNHFIIQGSPLFIEGEAGLTLFVIIDVTEKIKSDQAVTQSQKLNALGALSGGIAHDFNNALAVIKANADLISNSDDFEQAKAEYLKDILISCENATGLTRQILSFVRNVPLRTSRVRSNQLAKTTISMVQNSIEPTHNIEMVFDDNPWVVCDQNLFKNAMINLILNARDAMPDGGTIVVRVFKEEESVVFSIEDSGVGIEVKYIERVIEPFFSMKPNEKGTGIGLSIVKQFAEKSDGEFNIISDYGVGTRAQIKLPIPSNSVNLVEEIKIEEPLARISDHGTFNIMVVDDNVMLAKSLKRQLEIMGHTAQMTHSLDEFVQATNVSKFDLVLCDIVLKTETGIDIWDYCQANDISSKFLYISGNISPDLRKELATKGPYRLIEKPIDFADLRREIQLVMNAD